MQMSHNADRAAVWLSIACIAHCLALPLLAVFLPVLGVVAEAEAVHWALGLLAIAISLSVPLRHANARAPGFLIPAGLGVLLIGGALFAEQFGIDETVPTVIGGCLLAGAHLTRLLQRNQD
ncbi:MAG: MerC domain-containing protein [Pseudomonadota bacterium]